MIQRREDFPYLELSIEERILLVEDIWDSIAAEQDQVPLTKAQKELLQKRLDAYEADPGNVVTWEEVKARVRARLDEFRARQ